MATIVRRMHRLTAFSLLVLFLQLAQVHAQPQLTIQSGHRGLIRCLALSADEKYLASAGEDKTVIVWDIESDKKILAFTGHENWIVALEFSSGSESPLLASGDYDGTVKIWDLKTARLDHEITAARPYSITSVDFSPDGEKLAIAAGTDIKVWNLKTRTIETVLQGHRAAVTKVFYGKDNHIFTSSLDGTLRIWNVVSHEEISTAPEKYGYAGMAVDPDKRLFAMAYVTGKIKIIRSSPQQPIELEPDFPKPDLNKGIGFREYRLGRFVKSAISSSAMLFLPNGKLAYNDGFKIRVCEPLTRETKEIVDIESGAGSTSVVFSEKRNSVFYDDGKEVKSIELNSSKPRKLGSTFQADFGMLSLDARGVLLAGGGDEALIMTAEGRSVLYEYQAEALAPMMDEFPNDFTNQMSLRGQELAAQISGADVLLRKETNRRQLAKRPVVAVLHGPGKIEKCWTDPLSSYILCSAVGSKMVLWNVATRKPVRTFEGTPATARFSPDLTYLAIAEEETVKIWNLKSPATPPTEIKASVDKILVFSPDNKFVATRVLGGTRADIVEPAENETNIDRFWAAAVETLNRRPRVLKIWDVKSGSHLHTLPMQSQRNLDYAAFSSTKVTLDPIIYNLFGLIREYIARSGPVSFSSDEKLIVYDELDLLTGHSLIKVWNLATNKEECVFEGHTSSIRRIIFSPDDKLVLSSGWDNTLKIWSIASKQLKATVLSKEQGWLIFTPDGRFDTNLNLREMDDVTWLWPQGGTRPLPLRVFLRDYYEPRLFRKILRDEPLSQARNLTSLNVTQPKVAIRGVESDGPDSVKVTVDVSDVQSDIQSDSQGRLLHSGVFDVRLFRNDQLVAQSTSDAAINEFLSQTRPFASAPDRLERELQLWRQTHQVKLNADGKVTLTFEHIKLPKHTDKKQVDFTAYAFNSDRVTSELSPAFTYRLANPSSKTKPRAYVVTIGVDANQSGWKLSFAALSANEIQRVIAARMAKEYEVVEVSLLATFQRDSFRPADTRAKKENLRAVLDMLAGRVVDPEIRRQVDSNNVLKPALPDDLVFIYVASHGFSDRYGNFSMIPYNSGRFHGLLESTVGDCLAGKGGAALCEDSRKFIANSISGSELATWLQGVDAGQIYMILDSCYSAAAPGSNFKPGPLGDRSFGQLAYDKMMTILTASQQSALSPLQLKGTLLSKTLISIANEKPTYSMVDLLRETEFMVPKNYQTLFPKDKSGIQSPVLFDFSDN